MITGSDESVHPSYWLKATLKRHLPNPMSMKDSGAVNESNRRYNCCLLTAYCIILYTYNTKTVHVWYLYQHLPHRLAQLCQYTSPMDGMGSPWSPCCQGIEWESRPPRKETPLGERARMAVRFFLMLFFSQIRQKMVSMIQASHVHPFSTHVLCTSMYNVCYNIVCQISNIQCSIQLLIICQ